jgi:hypothetical protein
MARFYPTLQPPGLVHSESTVWIALTALDDQWRVFHSVRWQSVRRGRQGDGEADFILLHPSRGIVVLEVKGGDVEVAEGSWFSTDRRGTRHRIKNPFEQAIDSKHSLIGRLNDIEPRILRVPDVCHGVVFPDGDVAQPIGMYGPRDIIWSSSDLLRAPDALDRLLRHWNAKGSLTPTEVQEITRILAPTVRIRSGLRSAIATAEAKLLELTRQQVEALDLMRKVRRALITGGPGTGKTVLAVHRARVLAADGARVLLTCFNQSLAKRLEHEVANEKNITARTFHSLCVSEARLARFLIPDSPDGEWWETRSAEILLEAAASTSLSFDAVVVDEGQDFAPIWFTALAMLLTNEEDGFFLVFADKRQALYRSGWRLPLHAEEYPLDVNCRSTLEILDRVNRIFGDETGGRGVHGQPPLFAKARDSNTALEETQQLVARLLDEEHLDPDQIVVLCVERASVDRLRGRSLGSCALVEPGRAGVVVETVHSFKGLEAEAVVLLLGAADLSTESDRVLAYVGMSRARSALVVVGTRQARGVLNWP